jgi:hypothetical protein
MSQGCRMGPFPGKGFLLQEAGVWGEGSAGEEGVSSVESFSNVRDQRLVARQLCDTHSSCTPVCHICVVL